MVFYKCLRCGYTTSYKNNFRSHLNRKFTCYPILGEIDTNCSNVSKFFKKIASLNYSLETYQNSYDAIVWIDSDCIFTNKISSHFMINNFEDAFLVNKKRFSFYINYKSIIYIK